MESEKVKIITLLN
jgi:serine/threonine protein kinase